MTFRVPSILLLALPALLAFSACGKKSSTEAEAEAAGYARLDQCDTLNWLGLPDSISCPASGGLCPLPGMDKVGTNVCLVGNVAYAYSVVAGAAFASQAKATLNATRELTGPATGLLKFDALQSRNVLEFEVRYSHTLSDTSPIVYTKTYKFHSP
jgi:hypothetical protein